MLNLGSNGIISDNPYSLRLQAHFTKVRFGENRRNQFMELRQKLLSLLGAKDYVPMRRMEIVNTLELDKDETKDLHKLLDGMLDRGEIARVKKDRLCIPKDADLVSGRILFRQSGAAVLIPDAEPGIGMIDGYPVSAEDTGVALHGDQVLARINDQRKPPHRGKGKGKGRGKRPAPDPGKKKSVRVIRILKRARSTITGTLDQGRHATFVIPDDPRIIQDILVPDPRNSGLRPTPKKGDKVVVKLLEWKQRHINPEGELVEVLGETHEPDAEFKAILYKYDLNPNFPAAVEKQTKASPMPCARKISATAWIAGAPSPSRSTPTMPKTSTTPSPSSRWAGAKSASVCTSPMSAPM